MDPLLEVVAVNAPGVIGVIVVVVIFVRYLEKRDAMFSDQMKAITSRLHEIEEVLTGHISRYNERGEIIRRIDRNTSPKRGVKSRKT